MKKYYEMDFDPKSSGWLLSEPFMDSGKQINSYEFSKCKFWEKSENLFLDIINPGEELSFSFNAFGMAVIREDLLNAVLPLIKSDEVQLIDVQVNDSAFRHFIFNVTKKVDCIDVNNSIYVKFDEDFINKNVAGHYKYFDKLVIFYDKISDSNVFFIEKFMQRPVVSEEFKKIYEEGGFKGLKFKELTTV